ncbi:hypothetical protein [Solibacillus cecembensis]|uniref:hypothetical protein n=1 Tax=Solibacillus cecembensis TaxID=459347 RepID=UPI003CFDCC46
MSQELFYFVKYGTITFYAYQFFLFLGALISDKMKTTKKYHVVVMVVNSLIFVLTIPLGLFIGIMATDDGNAMGLIYGFFFVTGIPLVLFLLSVFYYFILKKRGRIVYEEDGND